MNTTILDNIESYEISDKMMNLIFWQEEMVRKLKPELSHEQLFCIETVINDLYKNFFIGKHIKKLGNNFHTIIGVELETIGFRFEFEDFSKTYMLTTDKLYNENLM